MDLRLDPPPDGNQLTAAAKLLLVGDLLDELSDWADAQAVVTEIDAASSAISAGQLETQVEHLHAALRRRAE